MIGKLKSLLLGDQSYAESAVDPEERQQLALAALLVELARADFDESEQEHTAIVGLLAQHFDLSDAESDDLLQRASKAIDESVSLFDFTRALHESLDAQQKLDVVRLLWSVALADNSIDKYEDYLVRKVSDLLYVSPSDVVRIKHEVADSV